MFTIVNSICYPKVGCFETGGKFYHPLYRPLNLTPRSPEALDVKFFLYTRNNWKKEEQLIAENEASIVKSNFNPNVETKFIIHGYIDNLWFGEWMRKMKDEFLIKDEYNVILVDWSKGNLPPYPQAVSNARVVGAVIAFFVNYLKETTKITLDSVHIIGHSLGAQVASYAGKRLSKVGRITGLDPASPMFEYMSPEIRLSLNDAQLVDVIHTDTRTFNPLLAYHGAGMREAVGHFDFYSNGGDYQPGCAPLKSFVEHGAIEGFRVLLSCYHQRAIQIFINTINLNDCKNVAVQCIDWLAFSNGHCADCGNDGHQCAEVGYNANLYSKFKSNTSLSYYFNSGPPENLCLHQYLIKIKFAEDSSEERGDIKLTLFGDKTTNINFNEETQEFIPKSTIKYIKGFKHELKNVKRIQFKWTHRSRMLDFNSWRLFTTPSLKVKHLSMKLISMNKNEELCFKRDATIFSDTEANFRRVECID
ncbi:pancreatic triacylglycerol lipase-like protein [Leptotrombidium deliense]|uniref:Pancreatic triacylglycerol lipase-like protein n=1 Tax=Leptotrombidium deliense TaxID=299467 RepID=A0A443SL97_9ACAR|nr:pancreatic triacylglycerol lipase-like protein [Leptotrombidium deliense]